jgi:osomolarity two-component system, sensor histidine kinase SLN1
MVLALAVWFQNYNFITSIRLSGLSLTASLKAAQVTSSLLLYDSQARLISTRILIQSALSRYNAGNDSAENWTRSISDFQGALGTGSVLVQAIVYPNSFNGNQTAVKGLLNVTALGLLETIALPYNYPNGSAVYLGDPGEGYPEVLYPNLTYGPPQEGTNFSTLLYQGRVIEPNQTLFLGPLVINETYSLLSLTVPLINNTSNTDVLGWMTVLANTNMISQITHSPEGLDKTGEMLIVAPDTSRNLFDKEIRFSDKSYAENQSVRFVLPPPSNASLSNRHAARASMQNASTPFLMKQYPAVVAAWTKDNHAINNAGAFISTNNEDGTRVSVGYATLSTNFLDWVVLIEQSHGEVVGPITHLRNVVLICVFSVTGLLLLIMFPMAHYSITPIRELAAATAKTVEPYNMDDQSEFSSTYGQHETETDDSGSPGERALARKEGFFGAFARMTSPNSKSLDGTRLPRRQRRTFRIPRKVPERKHFVTDELTELTRTFNEMSDELGLQYGRLEERVKERTAELEKSKKAAEAANQSKTLFIANISHELKTPLNGILGLTTVCMNEDDLGRIRSTLNTIYKSGDLLLHLLTDLLTFSKNEVGQQLSIDETEFRLSDLSTQLMPTFEKQAREAQVDLKVLFLGTNDAFGDASDTDSDKLYGPMGTGRVRDMCLWGDKNRILQVLMNFVSNSLKFTPAHGSVTVRVRCTGLVESFPSRAGSARKSSLTSRKSKTSSNKRVRMSDSSLMVPDSGEQERSNTHSDRHELSISVAGGTAHIPKIAERQRSMSPPPMNTKDLSFEFEVEDTGPGIPPEQQQMIFEPFVQGDLGLSKKYGGTGLGLSICAQLAALMGGDISLDSKVGVGSKFTMRIPLRYVTERTPSMASSTHRSLSKASSLVGQALHDDTVDPSSHNHTHSTTSLSEQNTLADVPRIVGFTAPYVAKETKSKGSPEAKINQMKKMEDEAAEKGRKVKVLVAEDNPVNQEVVLRMLKLEDVYGKLLPSSISIVAVANVHRCHDR